MNLNQKLNRLMFGSGFYNAFIVSLITFISLVHSMQQNLIK